MAGDRGSGSGRIQANVNCVTIHQTLRSSSDGDHDAASQAGHRHARGHPESPLANLQRARERFPGVDRTRRWRTSEVSGQEKRRARLTWGTPCRWPVWLVRHRSGFDSGTCPAAGRPESVSRGPTPMAFPAPRRGPSGAPGTVGAFGQLRSPSPQQLSEHAPASLQLLRNGRQDLFQFLKIDRLS